MSEMKQLIEKLCPEGVEWKKIETLFTSFNGMSGVSNKWKESGNCVFIDYLNVYNNMRVDVTKLQNATVKSFEQNKLKRGDILLTSASETPDECALSSVIRDDIPDDVFLDDHLFAVRLKDECKTFIDTAFVNYYMHSSSFRVQVCKKVRGVTRFYITGKPFMSLEIPVPPLAVQRKIVEILDHFTGLEAELEAELEARRKQYEYYRNALLSFDEADNNVKWMKMSEVGTLTRGKRFVRTDIVEEGVPCIHYGDMYTYYGLKAYKAKTHLTPEKAQKMRFAKKNDVVIVGAGENKNDIGVGVAWLGEEDAAVHDACYIFSSDLYPQYVSHFLRTESYHKQIYPLVSEGKICSISAQSIGRAIIPVPPLSEQQRIVGILDRFEALTTDLQSGLPAEIEARRKQYEYYREKLLTFKRKTA